MQYCIEHWATPALPIVGKSEYFPVRHVFCVGRNYAEHAREMGHDASKEPPFFFTKSADSVVPDNLRSSWVLKRSRAIWSMPKAA